MINKDFYPTPPSLAIRMAGMIDHSLARYILEPHAGKGDLADAVKTQLRYSHPQIDCVELDPDLRATLIGKEYRVVDSDFLAFAPAAQYDTIIMNPPFADGAKHVLHAWNMLFRGDVIAQVNAETLRNPHTKERQLLTKIIEEFGDVEYVQDAYITAERTTSVEIALIHLKKRASINTMFFDDLDEVNESSDSDDEPMQELAITGSQIANKVMAYNKAIEAFREAAVSEAKARYYAEMITNASNDCDETNETIKNVNKYVAELRESAWQNVVYLTEFQKIMTATVRTEFAAQASLAANLEFTEKNVRQFLKNLIIQKDKIMNDCVLDTFDLMTKYYPDNRVHIEGWKSNDVFFIGKRVVLPQATELDFSDNLRLSYAIRQKLDDIDQVMTNLSGATHTITSIVDAAVSEKNLMSKKIESTFFTLRAYKKGTIHLQFKDKALLDRFNLAVGRQRGWLNKADDRIPEEFWLLNE